MNHAQIDYLLQIPVSRPEPATSAGRARDVAPVFGHHFRQASEASDRTFLPPAQQTRVSVTDRDDNRQSASRPTPPAQSPDANEEAATTNDQHDADALEQAATAAVAGPLSLADPASQTSGAKGAGQTDGTSPHSEHAERSARPGGPRSRVAAKTQVATIDEAADAAPVANETDVEAEAVATPADPSTAAKSSVTKAAAGESPRAAVNPDAGDPVPNDKTVIRDHGEYQAVTQAASVVEPAVGVHAAELMARATTENRKATADLAPKKSDKRSAARAVAAPSELASTPNERPAAAAQPAEAPAAASVQPQSPAGVAPPSAAVVPTAKPEDAAAAAKNGPLSTFVRLERGSASGAHGSRRTARGEGARQVDPARFVSRVARAIDTAHARGGPLQLRLSPPELGAMRLEISVNQGALTATIETDNSTARQLLLDNLPALRDRLAEQNVKIERFDVDVRRNSSGNEQANPGPQERSQHDRHESTPDRHGAARRTAAPPAIEEALAVRRAITNTSINVVA